MQKGELPYHHEYERSGAPICPETGTDLSNFSADSVRAHAEALFPGDPALFGGDEARERKAILLKIAASKEK